jgi:hypothetical protein
MLPERTEAAAVSTPRESVANGPNSPRRKLFLHDNDIDLIHITTEKLPILTRFLISCLFYSE